MHNTEKTIRFTIEMGDYNMSHFDDTDLCTVDHMTKRRAGSAQWVR